MAGSPTQTIFVTLSAAERRWVEVAVANIGRLTRRELDVASWTAASRTNAGIAHELNITSYAVQAHLRNIYNKLGLKEAGLPAAEGSQLLLDKRALLCKAFALSRAGSMAG
jgi:DNA-binding CsgD family transcriptional regulator